LNDFCGKHAFFFVNFQSVIVDLYEEGSKINEFFLFNFQVKRIKQVKIVKLFINSLEYLIVFFLIASIKELIRSFFLIILIFLNLPYLKKF